MDRVNTILKPITEKLQPIVAHAMFIVVIGLLSFLIFTVYTVSTILDRESDETYRSEQESSLTKTQFDKATIDRIENLRSSSQNGDNLKFSVDRTRPNPFNE